MIDLLLQGAVDGAWFDNSSAGLVGGIGGAAVGVLAGGYGALSGVLAPRGIGRRAMLTAHVLMIVLAVCSLAVGIYALATDQPYHVWYPFVLLGFIPTVVLGVLLPVVRKRYDEAEQRRIDAEALRRG